MNIKEYALCKLKRIKTGARLIEDSRYRLVAKAVISLILNLLFGFYNGILGVLSSSLIFTASAIYYILLWVMGFAVVMTGRKEDPQNDKKRQRRSAFC